MWSTKIRAEKKSGIYPTSADPQITPKGNSTYPMRYMATFYQVLLLILLSIKTHQLTKKSGTNLWSAVFLPMADPKYILKVSSCCTWLKYWSIVERMTEVMWSIKEKIRQKNTLIYPKLTNLELPLKMTLVYPIIFSLRFNRYTRGNNR